MCDAGFPLTLEDASVEASQCVAEVEDEFYEKPEIIAPVVVAPVAVIGTFAFMLCMMCCNWCTCELLLNQILLFYCVQSRRV